MVKFGVAGFPPAFEKSIYRKDRVSALRWLSELGLDALELQMTYGPRTSIETCKRYRDAAEQFGITLSIHASYFIVFTSTEKMKLDQSGDTLKRTFELGHELGAKTIVLHPGSLYGADEATATARFIDNIGPLMNTLIDSGIGLFVETAGKVGQLGSVPDILKISSAVPGIFPCIDFGHVHARTLGTLDNSGAIESLMEDLRQYCAADDNRRIHFHYTPILYGPKGEITHKAITDRIDPPAQKSLFDIPTKLETDNFYHPRYEPVAAALRTFDFECTVISETMNTQEEGALALKGAYRRATS